MTLETAAKKYHRAQEARDKALAELAEEVRAADVEGVRKVRIIERTGLARQTVFDILAKPKP